MEQQAEKKYLDTREAAAYLGLSPRTLENLRWKGGGPAFLKPGGRKKGAVRYTLADLDAWAGNPHASTADQGAA